MRSTAYSPFSAPYGFGPEGSVFELYTVDPAVLALAPWQALGDSGCDRLAGLLKPLRRAVLAAGDWPAGNPIGVPESE